MVVVVVALEDFARLAALPLKDSTMMRIRSLSAALLLEHVGETGAAQRVRTAVWAHLKDRVDGARGSTAEVGADVAARV